MRRELVATINEQQKNLVVERGENGTFQLSIDGRQQKVDAVLVAPDTWSLLIEGRSYLVDLDPRRQGTVILTRATETPVTVEDARRKRLAEAVETTGGGGKGEIISAPIAGRVVKLLVAVGDEVAAGQGVVVLEAMKMENEISAERGGKVEKIHVEPGVSVDTQDLLVTLA